MKEKLTIEKMKQAFKNIPYGEEFNKSQIEKIVTDLYGVMEVIPSDYCYNRVNDGIDIEKNIRENNCLFEYVSFNKYRYIGAGQNFSGNIYHKPKGGAERVVGKINGGKVEWYK